MSGPGVCHYKSDNRNGSWSLKARVAALLRVRAIRVLAGLSFVLSASAPLRAQAFVEAGAGWTYVPNAASQTGSHFRLAFGREVASRFSVRVEGSVILYDVTQPTWSYPNPCTTPSCDPVPGTGHYEGSVVGIAGTGLLYLTPAGRIYLVGGAGLFFTEDVSRAASRASLIGGLGFWLPINNRLRAFSEARVIGPFSTAAVAPQWVMPFTIGIRTSMAPRNQR